jgi:hypothetical protein
LPYWSQTVGLGDELYDACLQLHHLQPTYAPRGRAWGVFIDPHAQRPVWAAPRGHVCCTLRLCVRGDDPHHVLTKEELEKQPPPRAGHRPYGITVAEATKDFTTGAWSFGPAWFLPETYAPAPRKHPDKPLSPDGAEQERKALLHVRTATLLHRARVLGTVCMATLAP